LPAAEHEVHIAGPVNEVGAVFDQRLCRRSRDVSGQQEQRAPRTLLIVSRLADDGVQERSVQIRALLFNAEGEFASGCCYYHQTVKTQVPLANNLFEFQSFHEIERTDSIQVRH
jgi:hypothetical protein